MDMVKKEDISFLGQMIASLEEAEKKLEESYKKKDYEKFAKSKKLMLQIQKQIAENI